MAYLPKLDLVTLEKHAENRMVMLYFYHPLCSACQDAGPALDTLMLSYPELDWAKCDLEKQPDIAAQHLVFTVPSLIILYQNRELFRMSRFVDIPKLTEYLQRVQEIPGAGEP